MALPMHCIPVVLEVLQHILDSSSSKRWWHQWRRVFIIIAKMRSSVFLDSSFFLSENRINRCFAPMVPTTQFLHRIQRTRYYVESSTRRIRRILAT
jgi:hypothetical protein